MNTKAILSAAGVAVVLASPVMAQPNHRVTPPAQVQTVYAPDVPVQTHNNGVNPDFQLGSEKN